MILYLLFYVKWMQMSNLFYLFLWRPLGILELFVISRMKPLLFLSLGSDFNEKYINSVWPKTPCLGKKLPIYKAQKILKPECTTVHEDFRILQQRSRWVSFRSNTK